MASKLIRDRELAERLGIPLPTIRADRYGERRLPFTRLGRSILYDFDEVVESLKQYRVGGTQQAEQAHGAPRRVRRGARHG